MQAMLFYLWLFLSLRMRRTVATSEKRKKSLLCLKEWTWRSPITQRRCFYSLLAFFFLHIEHPTSPAKWAHSKNSDDLAKSNESAEKQGHRVWIEAKLLLTSRSLKRTDKPIYTASSLRSNWKVVHACILTKVEFVRTWPFLGADSAVVWLCFLWIFTMWNVQEATLKRRQYICLDTSNSLTKCPGDFFFLSFVHSIVEWEWHYESVQENERTNHRNYEDRWKNFQ